MGPEMAETICSALLLKAEHHVRTMRSLPAWDRSERENHHDQLRACWAAFRAVAPRSFSYGASSTAEFFALCADCAPEDLFEAA
jgi:hypothetical protein